MKEKNTCWPWAHKWTKWKDYEQEYSLVNCGKITGNGFHQIQERICSQCKLKQIRKVTAI